MTSRSTVLHIQLQGQRQRPRHWRVCCIPIPVWVCRVIHEEQRIRQPSHSRRREPSHSHDSHKPGYTAVALCVVATCQPPRQAAKALQRRTMQLRRDGEAKLFIAVQAQDPTQY